MCSNFDVEGDYIEDDGKIYVSISCLLEMFRQIESHKYWKFTQASVVITEIRKGLIALQMKSREEIEWCGEDDGENDESEDWSDGGGECEGRYDNYDEDDSDPY